MHDYLAATVKDRWNVTPSMIRIVLEGGDLHRFESTGRPDEFVWLSFPVAGSTEGAGRYYTVRRWDKACKQMTIDFVRHDTGIATSWAKMVLPGETIHLLAPRARFSPPADARHITLVADMTGLPAVGRILEELPCGFKVVAHIEIPCKADRQTLESAAEVALHWHPSPRHGDRPTRLTDIARSAELPPGPGYVWIAGEASAVAQSRKHFRDVLGIDKSRITSVGYWVEGQARA